jgi:hypothetical protein
VEVGGIVMNVDVDRYDLLTERVFEWTTTFRCIETYADWINQIGDRHHNRYSIYCFDTLRRNDDWFVVSCNRDVYDKWCHSYSFLFLLHSLTKPSYELFCAVLKLKLLRARKIAAVYISFSDHKFDPRIGTYARCLGCCCTYHYLV